MYWLDSILVRNSDISDMSLLADWTLAATFTMPSSATRALLVHVETDEDVEGHAAYCGLTALACQMVDAERHALISLTPLLDLAPGEQQSLRLWLIARHWPAWARAALPMRSRLGFPDPPVSLSEAARQTMLSLPTVQSAAAEDRLPTLGTSGRQLIYIATIAEAHER